MNKSVLAIMLLGGLLTTAGAAAQDKPVDTGIKITTERKKAIFENLDTDKDGKLSRAEAEKAPKGKIYQNFDAIDTSKDNFIERKELKAYREERKAAKKDKKQE